MSEYTEAVERAVDTVWRPTREIVERTGYEPTYSTVQSASRRLRALARQGRIERSEEVVPSAHGPRRRATWRRKG